MDADSLGKNNSSSFLSIANNENSLLRRFDSIDSMDAFDILGVGVDATDEKIRSSYLKLALLYHPDKIRNTSSVGDDNLNSRSSSSNSNSNSNSNSSYIFNKINEAWTALSQPKIRESLGISRLIAGKTKNFELNCEMLSISSFDLRPDGTYSKNCRCGGNYVFSQEDLDEEINTFQCSDCSLYASILQTDD